MSPAKAVFGSDGKMVAAADFASDLIVAYPWNKVAVGGFAGSGKSRSSAEIMAGIYNLLKSRNLLKYDAPLLIIDTEQASQFLVDFFKSKGVPVKWKQTRSLADVKMAFDLAAAGNFFGVYIDSLTHVLKDFVEAWQKQNNVSKLEMRHYGQINPLWEKEFGRHMVSAETHIVFTGRGTYDYEMVETEKDGKVNKAMERSGVKMQITKDSPFDPNLVVWMAAQQKPGRNGKVAMWREAFVMKDRSGTIDGKTFGNERNGGPQWKDFEPHFLYLLKNYNPDHAPVAGMTTHVDSVIPQEQGQDPAALRKQQLIDEIKSQLYLVAPGQTASEKQARATIFKRAFDNPSFEYVKRLEVGQLEAGLKKIQEDVGKLLKAKEVELA